MFKNEEIEYKGMSLLFEHQNIVLSYLHPENPYRSLIVLYRLGSGKTYAACCLAQLYLLEGFDVLYMSNSISTIENFISEYKKMIIDLRLPDYRKRITAITFTKFYKSNSEKEYGLIVVDEVHNLREIGVRYLIIQKKLNEAINSKILLMSATPIIDNPKEMDSIKRLSGEENPKILKGVEQIAPDLKIEYQGTKVFGETLYLSQLKGKQLKEYSQCNNKDVFTRARQSSLSYSNTYNPLIPLEEQSCKISNLIKVLDPSELTVIFCFYINRGINILRDVLELCGYKEYKRKTSQKTYAIIHGNTPTNISNNILKNFNAIDNIDGLRINVLIGSSVMKESITLHRVRSLHILTPFWNYSQIKQSIGRAIRYNSHVGIENPTLKIYLHASYVNDPENPEDSIDIKMWNISTNKKSMIKNVLDNTKNTNLQKSEIFGYPEPDNVLVFKIDNVVWDFTDCFDHNKFKISWCKIYREKAIKYDLKEKTVHKTSIPPSFTIHTPHPTGYTIWRSAIDNKLRLTYMSGKLNKYSKRGKLLANVKTKEIEKELKISSLKEYLLKRERYFDKQIEYVL